MRASSLADDLCECREDFGWMFTCCSNASTILVTPPVASLALEITFSVLFAPIAFISFFISEFLFSWNRSISMFFPAPPFQLTVAAHLQRCASASDSSTLHCRLLISISIENSLLTILIVLHVSSDIPPVEFFSEKSQGAFLSSRVFV